MRSARFSLLLCSLLLIPPVRAQQAVLSSSQAPVSQSSPQPVSDPQAVAALQRALAALGGTTHLIPTSIVASGTYTRYLADSAISYPLRVKVLTLDKFRWEIDTPDQGTVASVISGPAGWRQYLQRTEAMAASEIPGNTFEGFPVLALARWTGSSRDGLTMVGTESLNGKTVYHISITPTLGGNADLNREKIYESTYQREIYLDEQTFLPIRIRYYKHPTDWRVAVPVDLEYSNFQVVNGIAFPTVTTSYIGDQMLNKFQYQSLTPNAPVAASDFMESVP